jgi:hypothetical protein
MKCRVLEKGNCEITQEYHSGHLANDIVGGGYTLDNVIAHSEGKIIFFQDGYDNMPGSVGNASYGNCVKIDHGNGYYTLYAHMQKGLFVRNGEYVKKGQVLGYMGNSGNANGGHLHFEVWQGNARINPTSYLDNDLPTIKKDYTGTITYQAYTNKWLPEVNKCDHTNDGYAGLNNEVISGFRCKPQFGELIYKAHIKNGQWLDEVNSKDYSKNDGSSYAGLYGNPIDMIKIKSTKGWVKYRVKTIEDGWLEWVESKNYDNSDANSYAGIPGHTIIGIQMY